jgi:serine/threonine protein kinase
VSIPSSVGRYRIDRVLGSGAFASVWLGYDETLAAPVAIKVLAGSLLDDLDVRNRFLEEARILRRADSERLVRVHDIGELPDGRPYFVMSYADRGTLADRMRERPLPVSEALSLAEEIAYGVEVINRLGIIHRDLKPSNILFQTSSDGSERLLIADLGLAKALAHASGAFTLPVGTPGYMSPEQARFGGGLDVRADVYGLGALTYHLLTGRPPGPAPVQITPTQLRPELSAAFDEVILRALEADREKRWPTAEAFARALSTLRPTEAPKPEAQRPEPQRSAPPQDATRVEGGPYTPRHGPEAEQRFSPPAPATSDDVVRAAGLRQPPQRPVGANPDEDKTQAVPRPQYENASPDDIGTTEVRLPPGFPGGPPPNADNTSPDPRTTRRDGAKTVQDGDRTAVYAGQPPFRGQQGQQQFPPGPPLQGQQGQQGYGNQQYRPAPGGKDGDKKKATLLIIAGAIVVSLIVVGGLLAGTVFSGGKGKKTPSPKPKQSNANFTTVSDPSGRITVSVPKTWPKAALPTWVPSSVGLADSKAEPVLRATPDTTAQVTQFRNSALKVPGVFVGLTTDVTPGHLPPASATVHSQCTKSGPVQYSHGTLTGTITRFTGCTSGTPEISEVGLVDQSKKFGLWIRIKQIDATDLTTQILDSLQVK